MLGVSVAIATIVIVSIVIAIKKHRHPPQVRQAPNVPVLNLNPSLQLYVTFEPGSHGVAAVELFLPLAITGKSPQCNTTICNIDISVSSVIMSTCNQFISLL